MGTSPGSEAPRSAPGTSTTVAVLWDMDGTLVDTEPSWIEAEYDMVGSHGGRWSREQALQLVGNDLLESGRRIREQTGIGLTAEQIVEELLDRVVRRMREEVPWREGARELLADLNAVGVPCGLVTMSYQRFVVPVLEALPSHTFAAVVTGDQVARGKPHPEPYLAGAQMLGVAPEDCLAIEDSDTGATSAQSAGCRVLVVPNHVPVPERPGREFASTLVGLSAGSLGAVPAGG